MDIVLGVKELELVIPPIVGYQYVAYPLCTALTRKEALPWFYSNFIHLYCHHDLDEERTSGSVPFSFYGEDFIHCPWLITQKLEREIVLDSPPGIVEFLVNGINSGYTISLNVDEYYIPHRRVYRQTHYAHDILVYGYDAAKRTFLVLGYDEEMQFRKTIVPFHELEQGFRHLEWTDNYQEQIYLYKFNKAGSYRLDAAFIKQSMEEYIAACNVSLRNRGTTDPLEAAFGVEVYSALICNIPVLVRKRDIRPIHILWEHKKTMGLRINYLCEQGLLPPAFAGCFQPIEEQAFALRHLLMKFAMTGDDAILEQGINEVTCIMESEKRILGTVAEALEHQHVPQHS
ncbi:BtrH N-terminal domain-containing protein [Paenibacillus sp. MER TA 81-3]|uniref:BtrH N-terminal domain-containing protein n=1 Tax=Paenibacillus sp. MER TA 81-3 TaxID=2939573 RepID=UPI00203F584F|nr:BtrH N-terminal domain-containing protein [Paenibacillus sp. MER TA 81-3]